MIKIPASIKPLGFMMIAISLAVGSAWGANFRWLEFSPVRHFTDSDWEMMTATADRALNEGKDGEAFTWSNPESGNSGSLTPAGKAESRKGAECRQLEISNHAKGLSGTNTRILCKQPDGEWKVAR